jgi:hypothetical protein
MAGGGQLSGIVEVDDDDDVTVAVAAASGSSGGGGGMGVHGHSTKGGDTGMDLSSFLLVDDYLRTMTPVSGVFTPARRSRTDDSGAAIPTGSSLAVAQSFLVVSELQALPCFETVSSRLDTSLSRADEALLLTLLGEGKSLSMPELQGMLSTLSEQVQTATSTAAANALSLAAKPHMLQVPRTMLPGSSVSARHGGLPHVKTSSSFASFSSGSSNSPAVGHDDSGPSGCADLRHKAALLEAWISKAKVGASMVPLIGAHG